MANAQTTDQIGSFELAREVDRVDHGLRDVQAADLVIEARVDRAGIDEVGRPELLDAAHALHLARVEQRDLLVGQVHVPVNGVAHDAVSLSTGH